MEENLPNSFMGYFLKDFLLLLLKGSILAIFKG
jgi:hypothetical protein